MAITIHANTNALFPTDTTTTAPRTTTAPLAPVGTSYTYTTVQQLIRSEYTDSNASNLYRGGPGAASYDARYTGGSMRTRLSGTYSTDMPSPFTLRGADIAPYYTYVPVVDLYSAAIGPANVQAYIGVGGANANTIGGGVGAQDFKQYSAVFDASSPSSPVGGIYNAQVALFGQTNASAYFPSPRGGVVSTYGFFNGGPGQFNGFRTIANGQVPAAPLAQLQSFSPAPAGGSYVAAFGNSPGTALGSISVTTSATSFNTTSDYRLKANTATLEGSDALGLVSKLRPRVWKWKSSGHPGVGFIAHEMQEDYPDSPTIGIVQGTKDNIVEVGNIVDIANNDIIIQTDVVKPDEQRLLDYANTSATWVKTHEKPEYQSMDSSFLVAHLVASVKELKKQLDLHETRITALETN